MIMERKRLDDLDDALKQADDQIRSFRMSTKSTAIELLNQHRQVTYIWSKQNVMSRHRFTAKPCKMRADGVDPSKQAEISQKRLIASLEHRLDKLRTRLSQTESQNEKLKVQINSLRRHRMIADKSHQQIEASIKETQKEVRSILDKSQEVSEARERIMEQLNELHRTQGEEREKFVEQMKSLADYIEKQNHDFEESIAAAAANTTCEREGEFFITRGNMTMEEEKQKMELVCEIETQIKNEEELMQQTKKKIRLYKESFDELHRVSGIDDIIELVQQCVCCASSSPLAKHVAGTSNQKRRRSLCSTSSKRKIKRPIGRSSATLVWRKKLKSTRNNWARRRHSVPKLWQICRENGATQRRPMTSAHMQPRTPSAHWIELQKKSIRFSSRSSANK